METTVCDWSSLPRVSIAKLTASVSVEDFMAFRATCASWRDAGGDDDCFRSCEWPRVPFLMSPNKGEFYSLARQKSFKIKIPFPEGSEFMESRFGWVLAVAESGQTDLLYPFSGERIQLPEIVCKRYLGGRIQSIKRSVLSANPSQTSDYVLVVLTVFHMAFWRPGDRNWTIIESNRDSYFCNLIFSNQDQMFYAVTVYNQIWAWDMVRHSAFLKVEPPFHSQGRRYLIESSTGELLLLIKSWPEIMYRYYRLYRLIKGNWELAHGLKEAIFVGNNVGFCILPDDDDKVIRSNCIYFTSNECYDINDCGTSHVSGDMGIHNLGIYNLGETCVQRFPQPLKHGSYFNTPLLWVAPSSLSFRAPSPLAAKLDSSAS